MFFEDNFPRAGERGVLFVDTFLEVRCRGILFGDTLSRGSQGGILFPDTFLEVR